MIKKIIILCTIIFAGLAIWLIMLYSQIRFDIEKIVNYKPNLTTQFFDRNGKHIGNIFKNHHRLYVKYEDIPSSIIESLVAIEDTNFFEHSGVNIDAILRAVVKDIKAMALVEGASTLTQQLVKTMVLSRDKKLIRKIKELLLALRLESLLTKEEILERYLNQVYFGHGYYGIRTAAMGYFHKELAQLNQKEIAMLVGLPRAPSFYDPTRNLKYALIRANQVVTRLKTLGWIGKLKYNKAIDYIPIIYKDTLSLNKTPYIIDRAIKELKTDVPNLRTGGYKISLTIDYNAQEIAKDALRYGYNKIKERDKYKDTEISKTKTLNGAIVSINNKTGEILAMVGSKDYFAKDYDGQVNVTLAFRQPGSAIKPITYVTAFKKGFTPATLLTDVVTHFPGGTGPDYVPKDYDNKDHGPVQLRFSLGNSLNIPAVKLLAKIGVKSMLQTAFDLGLESLEPTQENMRRLGLSVTLGGGEVRLIDLISAYAAFANGGLKVKSQAILKVEDNKGRILEEYKPMKGKRVLTKEQAFLINDILADNKARLITFGSHSLLNISGRKIAVKTGTTDNMRDNWAIGWDPKYIVAAWVGNNDNSVMKKVASGVSGASPIWRRIILTKLKKEPIREFPVPNGIFSKEVDLISGFPSHDNFPSRQEFFIKGTEPAGEDPIHTKLKICRSDEGKLAPNTLVTKGEYNEKEFIVLKENDPLSSDGKNRWQEAIDAWIAKQNDVRYKYPHDYCEASDKIIVKIKNLENNSQINEFEFEVEAEVVSNKKIVKVEFYADDNLKDTLLEKPYKTKLILEKGLHKIKVIAKDEENNKAEKEITIGVKVNPLASPSPSPSIEPSPSPSPSPSPNPSISPSPSPLHS